MRTLYTLTFYDVFNNYREEFFIGVFESRDEAENAAKRYLSDVPGFRDHNCGYEIKEKQVIGEADNLETVSIICGWNSDDNMNSSDIWESDLYTDINTARTELADIQKKIDRQEWCVDTYKIGECLWQDGFVRV